MGTVVPPHSRKRMKRCRCSPGQLFFVALLGTAALLVRLADGYAWCQEYWNWDGKRHSSADGRRWPANDGVVITYINGIFHSVPEWESITHQLQTIFGHEVRPFYNPSSGWWITDASKAGYHLLRKPANDTIAKALGQHLAQAVEDVGRGRVLHIAHSGGALITYLAAQHHLTRRQRDKIDVLTFGGARSITRKYFSGRVVNYYARNDPLVKLDRRAAELMKLTNNTKFQEINEKHNTTFIFLEGRARQFVLDHSLEGPTYQHALRKEAKAFRRAHFGPLSPLSWDYEHSLMRLARKKVAQLSGLHDFFNTERFGLRSLRKSVAHLTGFHGFFSGKNPGAKGVAVSVVGSGSRKAAAAAAATAAANEVTSGARWWWPWGRRKSSSSGDSDGVKGVGVVSAPVPGADGSDAPGGGDRFWLGFRWSRRRKQQGEEQEVVGGVTDLAASPPLLIAEGTAGEGNPGSLPRSRWEQVRGAWSFGRPAESEAVGATPAATIPEAQEDSSEEEEEDKSEGVVKGQVGSSPESSSSSSRPRLSIGWTPWGGRAKDRTGVSSASLVGEEGAGGEAEGTAADEGGAAAGASTAVTVAVGDGAAGDAEEQQVGDSTADDSPPGAGSPAAAEPVSPSRDEVSYLRRWWPGSSSTTTTTTTTTTTSSSVAQGTPGEADEGAAADPEEAMGAKPESGTGGGGGGEKAGDGVFEVTTGRAESRPELVAGQPEPPEPPEPDDENSIVADEGGDGQAKSVSLLRRWWPESKKQGPTSPAPVEEGGRSLNASQDDGGGVSTLEVGAVGSEDDDEAEGLENGNGATDEWPAVPPGLPVPESTPQQQQQEEEEQEDQQQPLQEGKEQSAPALSTPGVREEMSAGQAAASFAQRFWEVFSNKPMDLPPSDETAAAAAPGGLDGQSEPIESSAPAEGNAERTEQTGEGVGPREAPDTQEAESIIGEVIVAEDFLRPIADDADLPTPRSAETAETGVEESDEARGDGDGAVEDGEEENEEPPRQGLASGEIEAEERDEGKALNAESNERGDGEGGGEGVREEDDGPKQGLMASENPEGRDGGEALDDESSEEAEEHVLDGSQVRVGESNSTPPAPAVRERVLDNVAGVEAPQR